MNSNIANIIFITKKKRRTKMKIRPESKTKFNKELTDDEVSLLVNMEKENLKYGALSDKTASEAASVLNAHPDLMYDILEFMHLYLNGMKGVKENDKAPMEMAVNFGITLDSKYGPKLVKGLLKLTDDVIRGVA